ncbi:hypothetical protein QYF61_026384 [Mycteria americana]|uniref:Rna-directed dna polymerase from mobile element jockey-like n=1 Tax=Mycteria americana TaxID=33587 RepID=A0AAN7NDX5_MYCAM|nr:hypothetical protein QYF61_026384 [Mycteria americana]
MRIEACEVKLKVLKLIKQINCFYKVTTTFWVIELHRTLLIPNWGEPVDTVKCWTAIQRDLDRLEEGSKNHLMKFQKDKCKVLHLRRKNPLQQYRLRTDQLGSSSAGRDLGILVDSKLNISHLCALAVKTASSLLGCINRTIASRPTGGIIPFYSALVRPHLDPVSSIGCPKTRQTTNWKKFSRGPPRQSGDKQENRKENRRKLALPNIRVK